MKIRDLGMSLLAVTKRMKCLALQNNAPILQIVPLLAPGKNCVTQKLHSGTVLMIPLLGNYPTCRYIDQNPHSYS